MPEQDRSSGRSDRRRDRTGEVSGAAKDRAPIWIRLSGAGLELAFITIVFGVIGAAIDRHLQSARPTCSAIGGLLGFTLGMIRFIRLATSISNLQRQIEQSRPGGDEPGMTPRDALPPDKRRPND
ncbi:Putative F0F1-ATPase subunit [Stieleria neptunia]|uniref:F0F1-ATPase subunit n=1 Tax=Stieleria neptunia TaxID=2527979 RepID=A0A518HXD0_9BACT|nr:AtpZ/AtpI family protein [Stieleria neptunia]QDV45518.1 Putative F0F1-ATPase subunit [Stieleria neptunia]